MIMLMIIMIIIITCDQLCLGQRTATAHVYHNVHVSVVDLMTRQRQEGSGSGSGMGEKTEDLVGQNPFEPYIDAMRKESEDPIFIIGLIVALAVVIITFGKMSGPEKHPREQSSCRPGLSVQRPAGWAAWLR